MRVGIIQSSYIPWRGYFDFIDDVDLFIFYDDVQYTKGDWRNRNLIKTPRGLAWLSVPVRHGRLSKRICETEICNDRDWRRDHIEKVRASYAHAAWVRDALAILEECLFCGDATISGLNIRLVRRICSYLGIATPMATSAEYRVDGAKTERLIALLKKAGATVYLSGPAARGYLDESLFRESGIRLEYKSYDYPPYPQVSGEFVGEVSILDLLANTGEGARDYLKSRTPNEVAVP